MLDLFYMGGPLFMSILTLLLVGVIVSAWKYQQWVKEFGLLALTFGILGQLIGLYSAFQAMEQSGNISQEMLAGGLKISMITTLYGVLIYLISIVIRIFQKPRLS